MEINADLFSLLKITKGRVDNASAVKVNELS